MTKIQNGISVGISAETGDLHRQMRQVKALLRSVKDPTESLNASLKHLAEGFKKNEYEAQQYQDAVAKAEVTANRKRQAIEKLRREYDQLKAAAKGAAVEIAKTFEFGTPLRNQRDAADRSAMATNQRYETPNEFFARGKADLDAQLATGALNARAYDAALDDLTQAANKLDPAFQDLQRDLEKYNKELQEAKREADAAAEAQKRLAKASKDALDAQRSAAGAAARRTNERFSHTAFFRSGKAELDAQFATGELSARAYKAALADLARQAHELNPAFRRAAEGAQFMRQFETAQERVNREVAEATRLYRQGSLSAEQYARATKQIKFNASLAGQALSSMKGALSSVLGPLVLGYSAFNAFKESIKLGAQLEQSRAKLKVFLGSLEDAEKVLASLRAMSVQGVSFAGGQRAVATMLQFGVVQKDLLPSFRAIAEITAGDTERMENLALAFSQSAAAGRLMGQELLQMVNAGFNPLKIISEQTGKSLADLKDDMSKGLITFDMVKQAFIDATSAGGKFDGLLEEIAETTSGKLAQSQARLQEFGIAFADLIKPATDGTLDAFNQQLADVALNLQKLKQLTSGGGGEGGTTKGKGSDIWSRMGLLMDPNKFAAQNFDVADAKKALANSDAQTAVAALDRMRARMGGPDSSGGYKSGHGFDRISAEEVDQIEQLRVAMQEEEDLRKRVKEGKAITAQEKAYLDFLANEERTLKKVSAAGLERARIRYDEQRAAAGTVNGNKQAFVDYVDKVGQGHFGDKDITIYQKFKADLEAANKEAKELEVRTERLREGIGKDQRKTQDKVNEKLMGEDAFEHYQAIKSGLNESQQAKFQTMIDSRAEKLGEEFKVGKGTGPGATNDQEFEDYVAALTAANKLLETKKKLKALTDAEDAAKKTKEDAEKQAKEAQERNEKITDELGTLRQKLQYEQDLLVMTKEQARVRALMHEKYTLDQAKAQAAAEKELQVAQNMAAMRERRQEVERAANPHEGLVAGMAELEMLKKNGLSNEAYMAAREKLLDENIKTQQTSAAPTIGKGSQEAFKALTGQTVDKVNQQIAEAKRANVLAENANAIRQRANDLLAELNDNKPVTAGP